MTKKRSLIGLAIAITVVVATACTYVILRGNEKETSSWILLRTHKPIWIPKNSHFAINASGVTSGKGTESDPYIIEGWEINATEETGISIYNTTAYFIIRNCRIYGNETDCFSAIKLSNVVNGTIENVVFCNKPKGEGICLNNVRDFRIAHCSFTQINKGIELSESSNIKIMNCDIANALLTGIDIDSSINCTVTNCIIYKGFQGVTLYNSHHCNLANLIIYNSTNWDNHPEGVGIGVLWSSNTTIANCIMYNNYDGIRVLWSSNNQITNCTCRNNNHGIIIIDSGENKLRDNKLFNNRYNFGIVSSSYEYSDLKEYYKGPRLATYYQDIDISNTVDGKPIYYLVNKSNLRIDGAKTTIGYLSLISCNNITVTNLETSNNLQGLFIAKTSNSVITNSSFYNNYDGIILTSFSTNNDITNCKVYENSDSGILVRGSVWNKITKTNIYNNSNIGISTDFAMSTEVRYCNVYNNTNWGVETWQTSGIYWITATHNWWGAETGPGENGNGTGDKVSTGVYFDPWLTEPVILP